MNKSEKNERKANRDAVRKEKGKEQGKRRARELGQFSAKHPTDAAHKAAQDAQKRKRFRKKASAFRRTEEAKNRSPREQLRRLDERLGVDQGAKKERKRLLEEIRSEFDPVGKKKVSDPGAVHSVDDIPGYDFTDELGPDYSGLDDDQPHMG